MYPQFFGFDKLPFRLRPDPEFLYSGAEYLLARAKLLNGLHGDSRLVLLAGAGGVGKTLLLEDVLVGITGEFTLCRINQPHISATELLQALLLQLGRAAVGPAANRARLMDELIASIDALDTRTTAPLLIVDEAQLLAGGTVSALVEILNRTSHLKILFAGRVGQLQHVSDIAARTSLVRPPLQVHLHPMDADGSKSYVEHRLAVAGAADRQLFTSEAHPLVFQQTGGTARLINVLCDAALHAACARASGHVNAAEILLAIQDSRWPEAVARERTSASVAPETMPEVAPEATPVVSAQLSISRGAEHIAGWPINVGCISIGRALDNELCLEAPYISRHHCRLVTVGNVSTIEDLGSVNGICVNGKVVKWHVLQHADQITLGEHVLTYMVS